MNPNPNPNPNTNPNPNPNPNSNPDPNPNPNPNPDPKPKPNTNPRWEASLQPVREAELVKGELLFRRNVSLTPQFNGTGYPIEDQVEFLDEGDALKIEVTLNNDTWVLQTDSGSGDIYMDVALKRLLVLGLRSDLAECTGWDAAVHADPDVVRVQAFNERKLTMTMPPLAGYDIRVPETVTLVVPGATVTSDEDIDASPSGEANAFVFEPDEPAAESLEVRTLTAGGTVSGALQYYSEAWYRLDVPADHGMVLSVDVEWDEVSPTLALALALAVAVAVALTLALTLTPNPNP